MHREILVLNLVSGEIKLFILSKSSSAAELYKIVRWTWALGQHERAALYVAQDAHHCNRFSMVADSDWQEDVEGVALAAIASACCVQEDIEGCSDNMEVLKDENSLQTPSRAVVASSVPLLMLNVGEGAHHRCSPCSEHWKQIPSASTTR